MIKHRQQEEREKGAQQTKVEETRTALAKASKENIAYLKNLVKENINSQRRQQTGS